MCDPMHGNTECVANFKTRRYDRIRAEVFSRLICPVCDCSLQLQTPGLSPVHQISHDAPQTRLCQETSITF